MGSSIYLEVDTGERLRIIRQDGIFAGKALISFLNIYSDYENYHQEDTVEYQWFKKFESLTDVNLRIFWNIIYAGEWSYGEEEYERFKKCVNYNPFTSEEEYKTAIRANNNLWKSIDKVIKVVEEILHILKEMREATYWYSPTDTVLDFDGLFQTLSLAKQRYGKEVRLKAE
jgi:hypothetical protein